MFHSFRWRIAIPYVLLILVTMAGVGIYLANFFRQTYLNDLEAKLLSQARLAGDAVAPYLAGGGDPAVLDPLAKHWSQLLGTRVTIIGADGTVLGESDEDRTRMDNHRTRPEIEQAFASGQGSSTRFSQTVGYDMLYTAVLVTANGSLAGFMRVALPLRQVQANIDQLIRALILSTLVATLLAILLAMWIANQTTQPLRQLTNTATQIAQGGLENTRLSQYIIPTSDDEVGQLMRAFNIMAIKLRSEIEALETERSKMAAVLDDMTDGVLIVDKLGKVQLINAAAESMFEINEKEALGHSLAEVLRHHQIVELWNRTQTASEPQSMTLEISTRHLYLQGVATQLGKTLPGSTLMLFQNLTRLRRLETVRRDFISNISHELRTPLASLKALTETLQEGALEDPPAARRFLERMETEVDALSQMVSELLELARIESGRVPLQMTPTSPCELITASVDRLHVQAERAGLMVYIECPEDIPLVLADPSRLEQVLVNLLHNAIKFTSSGGEIVISAGQQDQMILFKVHDTGIGIPADDLSRIFERFYKTDRARASGGTGLGLAIARHLVEAHGGRIWAESSDGKGSTFYFSIPLAQEI